MIIGKIDFPIYGLLIVLSILLGTLYISLQLKKEKLSKEQILYFAILNIAFTLFGSLSISRMFGNSLSSYAGLFCSIICALVFNRIIPKNNIYLKYTIISLPLIYAIGKIGCFIAGCCYGIEYSGILSVTYTDKLNISLFPIQELESIIFLILFIIFNKIKNNKYIIEITLIVCASCKLLLDFLRYDHMTQLITTNQIISLAIILIGIVLIIRKKD